MLPVRLRRHRKRPHKAAAQGFFRAESAAAGDALDGQFAFTQQTPGGFDAHLLDGLGGRVAGLRPVMTQEAAFTHAYMSCQVRDRKITRQVVENPAMQIGKTPAVALQGQYAAELCLPARTLEEYNQVLSDGQGDGVSQVFFHHRQARSMPAVTPAEVQMRP